jgi:hypothetical protein
MEIHGILAFPSLPCCRFGRNAATQVRLNAATAPVAMLGQCIGTMKLMWAHDLWCYRCIHWQTVFRTWLAVSFGCVRAWITDFARDLLSVGFAVVCCGSFITRWWHKTQWKADSTRKKTGFLQSQSRTAANEFRHFPWKSKQNRIRIFSLDRMVARGVLKLRKVPGWGPHQPHPIPPFSSVLMSWTLGTDLSENFLVLEVTNWLTAQARQKRSAGDGAQWSWTMWSLKTTRWMRWLLI